MSELSSETRAFLQAAAATDGASVEDRARVRQRLMRELGAAAFATGALAVATQQATMAAAHAPHVSAAAAKAGVSLFGKIVLAAALTGAVSTTALLVVGPKQSKTVARLPAPMVARALSHQGAAQPVSVPARDVELGRAETAQDAASLPRESSPPPVTRARQRANRARGSKSPPDTATTNSMAAELALVGRTQAALRDGRAADALGLTNEHATLYPQGALHEERAALEMLALCALGRASSEQLGTFLRMAPESPLKARVRVACGGEQ